MPDVVRFKFSRLNELLCPKGPASTENHTVLQKILISKFNMKFRPSSAQAHQSRPSTAQTHQAHPSSAHAHQSRSSPSQTHQAQPSSAHAHQSRPSSAHAHQARQSSAPAQQARQSSVQAHKSGPSSAPAHQARPDFATKLLARQTLEERSPFAIQQWTPNFNRFAPSNFYSMAAAPLYYMSPVTLYNMTPSTGTVCWLAAKMFFKLTSFIFFTTCSTVYRGSMLLYDMAYNSWDE